MPSFLRSVALAALVAAPLSAQGARDQLLATPKWLNDHLHDQNVVVLHVGPRPAYEKSHIPGSYYVEQRAVAAPPDSTRLSLQLPNPDSLRATLARFGVSDNSQIVVVFGEDWVSPSTRVFLTLDYAGFGGTAKFLDGGLKAWTAAGFPTTADISPARTGNLSPLKIRPVAVSAEYVRDNIGKPGIAVVDGRAAVFYDGVQEGGPMDAHRKGHIKGALSVPFTEVTDDALLLKPADQLQALFTKAGVKPGDTVIGYCHIGQQATAMLFAARTLGYKVALYDGSFEDWARRDWPVAVPPGK